MTPQERAQAFGRWLRELREARGLEARAVSRMIGASKNYVQVLESGRIIDPSFPMMLKLASLYHVDPAEMIERVYGVRVEDLVSTRAQLHEALRKLGYSDALAYQIASIFMQLAPNKEPGAGTP